ncbi:MAG: hypothetical protein AVDCRST_MAG45-1538 [uncultured Solirubrobacterales bacterium]|uniref:Uncharacterized protein n=1 Tax=uncultured Solirubrobacterales bacterium TaxID=768556 RepID=A0A6J4STI4_9ACTN|nr:MAG: hypothetical protein AVDCRST_MAG45-1538 [uncultured Solirubrobacterales bacterium]
MDRGESEGGPAGRSAPNAARALAAFAAAARRDPGDRDHAESLRRARRVARAGGAR